MGFYPKTRDVREPKDGGRLRAVEQPVGDAQARAG